MSDRISREKIIKLFFIVLGAFLLQSRDGLAQTGQNGQVFAINDFRSSTSQTVIVKWFANKVYYQDGFNVYRKTNGDAAWTKINPAPITVKSTAPQVMIDKDAEVKTFLDVVNKTSYAEFQKGVPKVFVAVKAILSPDFAELLGIVHYDATVEKGETYQYEVRGIIGGGEEVIGASNPLVAGPPARELPPTAIKIERKKTGIEINWQPEELRYYGVNIYRKSATETEWKKITDLPRSIYKSKDQHGNETYPPVFYLDNKIEKDVAYEYQLAVIDYFGQPSDHSETISIPVIDFDPPLPALNLITSINVMDLTLSWDIQLSEDLAGFKVYRSSHTDSLLRPVHDTLLPKVVTKFTDKLLKTGGYYYSVSAVDNNGNESSTGKIFIEVRDVTPPAPPTHVLVKTDTGKVILTWLENTEPDLRGYYVYRSLPDGDHSDNEFVVMNTKPITGNTYTEVLPKNVRNKFVYAVVAEDQSYNRSKLSPLSVVRLPDAMPPTKPLIKDVAVQDNTLVIEWLPNPDTDLSGYTIFRSTDSVNFTRINVNLYPAKSYKYTDRLTAANTRYFYYIQAVDSAGNSSVSSNIFTGMNKKLGETNIAPSTVKADYIKSVKHVHISWALPMETGLLGAVIYKSNDAVNFRPVTGLLKNTTFNDKEVKKGATYYYQVRAYASSGVVKQSETFQTTIIDKD